MPKFDFQCQACEAVFEKTLPFGSKSKPACTSCGSKRTQKLISTPMIMFKGSGFYKTDSGSSQNSESKQEKEIEAPKPVAEATEKSEKKPETKSKKNDAPAA